MNNSKNMNMNNKDEVNRLNNIIDENEIKISKLELDKKALEQKLDEYQKSHENELKLMLDYKNSELAVYQNIVDKYKNNNDDLKNNFNLLNNGNNNGNNDMIFKNFQNQLNKMKQEINSKNQTINLLNKKISQFNEDYNKKLLEIKQSSNENINQTQEQVEQLIIERDELLRKNENLTRGLMQFNDKVKEVNLIYNNKTENYNRTISACEEKMKEYKLKIDMLSKKNNELNNIIKNLRYNTMINNDNFNNNNENDDDNYLGRPKTTLYNMNNNYMSNRIENKYQGISKYKHFSRQNVSPFIKNRKIMAYTDNRNNIKNNYNFDEIEK